MKASVNDIELQAVEWAAKTGGEELPAEQQAALDAWLHADPRHLGAYTNACAALARVDRLGPAAMSLLRRDDPPAAARAVEIPRRRFILTGSIAASFAAAFIAGTVWWTSLHEASYATATGQTQAISLPDGSAITLNTDTRTDVHYSLAARDITLARGEALFDVAKNKLRPFVVKAKDVRVRAVGTSFSVRSLASQPLEVMVREGVVEIDADGAPPVLVHAGSRAVALPGGRFAVEAVSEAQIAQDLAWRRGHIFFRHQTLACAAKQFARYSKTPIVIDDPGIAGKTVTGLFVSTDPAAFAKAVAISLDLRAEVDDGKIRLTHK